MWQSICNWVQSIPSSFITFFLLRHSFIMLSYCAAVWKPLITLCCIILLRSHTTFVVVITLTDLNLLLTVNDSRSGSNILLRELHPNWTWLILKAPELVGTLRGEPISVSVKHSGASTSNPSITELPILPVLDCVTCKWTESRLPTDSNWHAFYVKFMFSLTLYTLLQDTHSGSWLLGPECGNRGDCITQKQQLNNNEKLRLALGQVRLNTMVTCHSGIVWLKCFIHGSVHPWYPW